MSSRPIQVGDLAPDFTLPDQSGQPVTLSDYHGKQSIVLYFYPKDFTPGCTVQCQTFSERYEEIQALGAEVLGISSDSVESHDRFAAKHGAEFRFLSDQGGAVRKQYGVARALWGLLDGRVTYIIDQAGKVQDIFNTLIKPKDHISQAIEVLKRLKPE